jgi:Outer membrane protein beta-barrel domain
MQTSYAWHMQYLLRRQIIVTLFLLTGFLSSFAQQREINLPNHEQKSYYFGITLSGNSSYFLMNHHPKFLQDDSVSTVSSVNKGGFGLGLLGTLRLVDHLEARINPQLIFATRGINYDLKYPLVGDQQFQQKTIESIYISVPLQFKFSSNRIDNFRVYVLGGGKYEYDLASNSQARRAEDLVKLKRAALGYEAGLGFNFYFPTFIFSPEIKFSNSFQSVHSRDPNLIYSNVVDKMQARMIVFSIHLEG